MYMRKMRACVSVYGVQATKKREQEKADKEKRCSNIYLRYPTPLVAAPESIPFWSDSAYVIYEFRYLTICMRSALKFLIW